MSFNQRLGLRPGTEPGTVELDPGPEHLVAPGTVHFAVLTTLAEVAAAGAAGAPVVPTQVSLQLMKRATADAPLLARGEVHRCGRTLIFAEGEVTQSGAIVARAAVVFARVG